MDLRTGFRIGAWAVYPLSGDIRSSDESVHLEPKCMEVLVLLAEQAGEVVLRDELLEKGWASRAVVADESLTRCIKELRQALGDRARNPTYIQTLHKRGYRLMQPVVPLQREMSDDTSQSAQLSASSAAESSSLRSWHWAALMAGLAAISVTAYVLGAGGWPWGGQSLSPACKREPPDRVIPVTALDYCEQGIAAMERRDAASLEAAIEYFRAALEIRADYGSAILNLARAMALFPSYADYNDCARDHGFAEPVDCYAAALQQLTDAVSRHGAGYIHEWSHAIRGYVHTKQKMWEDAAHDFLLAEAATPGDAETWHMMSQFLASVGDLEGALRAASRARELDPESLVFLNRVAVILMWLDRTDDARALFAVGNPPGFEPYSDSQLVLSIRNDDFTELSRLLHSRAVGLRQSQQWIDIFIEGLRDPAKLPDAVDAVRLAIEARELVGQSAYGAWVYLKEPGRAIDEILKLMQIGSWDLDVEFLFAPETRVLRDHPDFRQVVEALGLRDYWNAAPNRCPALFERELNDWCG